MPSARSSLIKVPFHVVLEGSGKTATPSVQFFLNPGFLINSTYTAALTKYGLDKLLSLSDIYQYYRCTKLKCRLLYASPPTNGAVVQVLGYYPDNPINAPFSFNETMQAPWTSDSLSIIYGNASPSVATTFPTDGKFNVIPRGMMLNQNVKWWRTIASGSVDDQFEVQGMFSIASTDGSNAVNVRAEFIGEMEFKDFVNATSTPMLRQPRIAVEQWSHIEDRDSVGPAIPPPLARGATIVSFKNTSPEERKFQGGTVCRS
jgi:hypothetical protein